MSEPTPDLRDVTVRFSHLKAAGRSAAHAKLAMADDLKPNQAMQRGTALHAALLGGKKIVFYDGARNEKHAPYREFMEANKDAEILLKADYDKANFMADAIRKCPWAQEWLIGDKEQTIRFRWNNLNCRATADIRGPHHLTEIKGTANATEQFWFWHHQRMGYNSQMWMQGLATDQRIDDYMIVAVEDKAPWNVNVFKLTERSLDKGSRILMLWAEKLKGALESGVFTGYSQAVVPLDIPEETPELIFAEDETE